MANCVPVPLLRRLTALALAAPLSLGLVAACGDDLEDPDSEDDGDDGDDGSACASTEVEEFPDGPYGSPEQLVLEDFDCPTDGLADVDLSGRWSLFLPFSPFSFQMPLIEESCDEGLRVELASVPDPLIHRDGTNLFIRAQQSQGDATITVAARVCASSNADELAVVAGQCFQGPDSEEPQCFSGLGQMKRFGRPEGEAEADGLELVSEWSGGDAPWPVSITTNVKVADGVAFISRLAESESNPAELRLVDVSNPAEPRDLAVVTGEDDPSSDFNDVKLFQANGGTHAVLAGGLCPVVDARDPANPVVVSKLGEYAHSIFMRVDDEGRPLAYLATYGPDVPIYDLSDPANPELVERVATPPSMAQPGSSVQVHDLYAEQDRLYLNGTWDGFLIMDRVDDTWTANGQLPTSYSHAAWVGEVAGRQIAIHGDEGYDAYLRVVDVDPESPEFMTAIGTYQTRPEVSIHNIMLFGDRVYLTYYHDGVRIIDLADPTSPQLIAHYHTWDVETGLPGPFEAAIGLDVDQKAGLVYVADVSRGLLILRETK
ncbi:MAG TPA: hypothetical protein VNO33_07855 [Kofleriaceae bacterium]|nr:hypothetical protein [Kofleriaceae bacterium]